MTFRLTRRRDIRCHARRRRGHLRAHGPERLEERALLSTFTVTNTLDNGDDAHPTLGSLRAAIVAANLDTDQAGSTIVFNMDPADPHHVYYQDDGVTGQVSRDRVAATTGSDDTLLADADSDHRQSWWSITPAAGLPVLEKRVTIDGYCQPGARPNGLTTGDDAVIRIELSTCGLRGFVAGSVIKGLAINRVPIVGNGGYGLELGGDGTVVAGNFLGTDVSGTIALGNDVAVKFFGTANLVGGTMPAARNVISGNRTGIANHGSASQNTIQGNFIGTDASGSRALGNEKGIEYPSSDLIGGTGPGARNVISGNYIGIYGGGGSRIQGNYIGTDPTGTRTVGNNTGIAAADGTTIGGSGPGEGNVISGNGIGIRAMSGGRIEGNLIGTDPTGTAPVGNGTGLYLDDSSNNTIGGTTAGTRNVISGNNLGIGIFSVHADQPATGNVIAGNLIGTDVSGVHALGNNAGINLGRNANGNVIGGTTAQARNVISGNAGDGVLLWRTGVNEGSVPTGNVISGNYIGTDLSGTTATDPGPDGTPGTADDRALGNNIGIDVIEGADNTIGGTAPGSVNVIDGGGLAGVYLGTTNGGLGVVTGNRVQGNLIGTDRTGTLALGNATGVVVVGGYSPAGSTVHDNLIGGSAAAERNVISGNQGFAVFIALASNNTVRGNLIGTKVGGVGALGNGGGVLFGYSAGGNTIGGTAPGEGNVIAYSTTSAGVAVDTTVFGGGMPSANTLRGNSIHDNAGPGIDLGRDGVTPNGSHTGPGPNDWQAFPVLSAAYSGASSIVVGSFHSTPNTTFTLDFYANAQPAHLFQGAYYGEGQRWLGQITVTTDGSGDAAFVAAPGLATSLAGEWVSATATGPSGTSEFTQDVQAVPLPPSSISGLVFSDFNGDGQVDFGEQGVAGVAVTLDGTDFLGNAVHSVLATDGSGAYVFGGLLPGHYAVSESQPAGYTQGTNSVGTVNGVPTGTVTLDRFDIALGAGLDALNYNYGERPAANGPVQHGQTAEIGFWNNKNGQALIKALNGGTGTQLGDWLAATLPHTFGPLAGASNLSGKSNADVAAFFQTRFVLKNEKLDAQVLATALSVYVTSATLDSTGIGTRYGFTVTGDGVGTATVNVGSAGAAFVVANNTVITVMDALLASDAQAVNGVLYGGDTTKRNKANSVFSLINQTGGI